MLQFIFCVSPKSFCFLFCSFLIFELVCIHEPKSVGKKSVEFISLLISVEF